MMVLAMVLAAAAAALHTYIFYLESIAWTSPSALKTFGNTPEKAAATRELAFNQGFYNLFLVIWTVLGIVFYVTGRETIGLTMMVVGTGSMVAAGVVLAVTSPDKRRAATIQMSLPVLALIAIAFA